MKRIDELWNTSPRTEKGEELQLLAVLVEHYEREKYDILPPDPIDAIKFRMEQMGLSRSDLAQYLGGRNRSTEVLNRHRDISVRMMRALHNKLKIPAESLLAERKVPSKTVMESGGLKVMLKSITTPDMARFDQMAKASRQYARKSGLKKSDVKKAIKRIREKAETMSAG